MSAGRLLTLGLGTPFSAVKYLVTLGLGTSGTTPVTPVVSTKTGTGGIDPGEDHRRRRGKKTGVAPRVVGTFKPTGLIDRPAKRGKPESVSDRADDSREIAAEVSAKLAREFTEENAAIAERDAAREASERTVAELLAKRQRTEEDELLLLLLMTTS